MVVNLILTPFITIALIILLIAGLRARTNKGGDPNIMKNIYVYLVLFATLMMIIGGSVSVFMSLADIISPAPYYESFEEYKQWRFEEDSEQEKKTEDELRVSYDAMVKNNEEQEMRHAVNTLIKSFGWIIIPLPIFIYFQRRIPKKE